jgi:pimeloyl-ACP methyl ester carboxylesterase
MIAVLLPGMDGTGTLFDPFAGELPRHVQAVRVSYPASVHLNYDQLADRVRGELPSGQPYIVVAESFSGPVALRLADRPVGNLRAIVLVASFVSRPLGLLGSPIARLPLASVFRARPPRWILRWLLMEPATPPEMVSAVQVAIGRVSPGVLAARMREALAVDCTAAALACPVRIVCLVSERDRLLGRRTARALRRLSQRIEVVTVQAPHLLLQCAPRAGIAAMNRLGLLDETGAIAQGALN